MSEAKSRSVWAPVLPVPEGAPAARVTHGHRGEPLRVFLYRDAEERLLGYVCRFLGSTGEAVHLPLTWCRDAEGGHAWRWVQFPRLRPLFGLDRLARSDADDHVLLCFDEHAADTAARLVPWMTAVSWPGGLRNIDEVDWAVLRGRSVWIWPTLSRDRERQRRDQPEGQGVLLARERQSGWKAAMKLERIITGYGGVVVSIVDPWLDSSRPAGWDAGMAGTQDWTAEQTQAWLMAHLNNGMGAEIEQRMRRARGEPDPVLPEAAPESVSTPSNAGAGSAVSAGYVPGLIYRSGDLASCLSNVFQILSHREEWRGVVALDEFAQKLVKRRPPPFTGGREGEWTDTDDTRTAMLLQREYGFMPSSLLVREAVSVLAEDFRFNPVADWLRSLKWDGVERLDHWMIDRLGVGDSPYVRRVSRWWIMGAVARALRPGCKFDYVLVLEGEQGKKKSAALAALGGDYFGDQELDFSNKDSMMALQGKLIYEIPELGALARSDERRQKAFLSRRVDEFRPPFGRGFIKCPRQLVFAGTTNEWEWNKDPTGGRRFWPIPCRQELDVEGLAEIRDQVFAEAVARFDAGQRYWPTEEEQRKYFDPEQLKVEQPDAYVDLLHDFVYGRTALFSLAEAATDSPLKLDASKLTRDVQTRIGIALRKLGCTRVEKSNGMTRFWYKPPAREEEARSKDGQPAQPEWESDDVPL